LSVAKLEKAAAVMKKSGKFVYKSERHCRGEESHKLGMILTYVPLSTPGAVPDKPAVKAPHKAKSVDGESETSSSSESSTDKATESATDPNSTEESTDARPAEGEQDSQAKDKTEEPAAEGESTPDEASSSSDTSEDEEGDYLGPSMEITLVETDPCKFRIEGFSVVGKDYKDYVWASSDIADEIAMQSAGLGTIWAAFSALAFYVIPAILLVCIVMVVCTWVIYDRAGEPGWAAIIPIYNWWVFAEVADKPGWWGLIISFGGCIPYAGGVIQLVMLIVLSVGVARAFERGILFALGMVFLPPIFYPILAFWDE